MILHRVVIHQLKKTRLMKNKTAITLLKLIMLLRNYGKEMYKMTQRRLVSHNKEVLRSLSVT